MKEKIEVRADGNKISSAEAEKAVSLILSYGLNYEDVEYEGFSVPRAIIEAEWSCNVLHMVHKWQSIATISESYARLPRFYQELSDYNREALVKWIIENYKG